MVLTKVSCGIRSSSPRSILSFPTPVTSSQPLRTFHAKSLSQPRPRLAYGNPHRPVILLKNLTSQNPSPSSSRGIPVIRFHRHQARTMTSSSPKEGPGFAKWREEATADISKYLQASHDHVFENNRSWASEKRARDPDFFAKLSAGQEPDYLWIGCSDSRIPAEQITGLEPGDAFVHRNIANLVCATDLNAMSVIEYAVSHLQVKHIVVCGHYGCGGVKAAMTPKDLGILNPWLRNIRDVYRLHEEELDKIEDETKRYDRLVELNVVEQCRNVIKAAEVQKSFAEKKYPIVHGWVFNFRDGLLKDLQIDFEKELEKVQKIYDLTKA